MGLLDSLFGRRDPTADWKAEAWVALVFDFSQNALCGVTIGEPVERLSQLGPVEDARAARREGRYCYYSKGIEIGVGDGIVTSCLLVWGSPVDPRYRPFAGACTCRCLTLPLNAGTGEAEIVQIFGAPYWRDEDQHEILLFYEWGAVEWEVELTRQGRLKAVNIVTPPLLADERQRRAYRVTKSWPP